MMSFDEIDGLKDKIQIVVNRAGLDSGQISLKKAKTLTTTALAVAPTPKLCANCGRTGATRPKPRAMRKAATNITLMSRGSTALPWVRVPPCGGDPAGRGVLLMAVASW